MIKDIKKGIIIAISFAGTLGLIGAVYGAWINMTNVSNGQTLDATLINNIIANQNDLNTRVSGTSIPTGFIGSFYLTSCPSGWIIADGANSTPDLRGQFIRANITSTTYDPDYGTRVGGLGDANKVGSSQSFQIQSHSHSIPVFGYAGGNQAIANDPGKTTGGAYGSLATGGTETRPKNIALLFCMKQ